MDNQIIQLKQKIKSLQRQLCQRTRNYLYHFKKSPSKQNIYSQTRQYSTQTQMIKDQNNLQDSIITVGKVKLFNQSQQKIIDEESSNFQTNQKTEHRQSQQISNYIQQKINCLKGNKNIPLIQTQFQQIDILRRPPLAIQQNQRKSQSHQINELATQIRSMKQKLQKVKTPKNMNEIKLGFFSKQENKFVTPDKINEQADKEKLESSQFKAISQVSECQQTQQQLYFKDKNSMYSSAILSPQHDIQQKHLSKQIKLLRREIKKLKAHLQQEVAASQWIKQALQISQQQNYNFRLEIQGMKRQIRQLTEVNKVQKSQQSSDIIMQSQNYFNALERQKQQPFSPQFKQQVDSPSQIISQSTKQELQKYRSQNQKYEQYISILQGVKKDYLSKFIQAKTQICQLKQENQILRQQILQTRVALKKNESMSSVNEFLQNQNFQEKNILHNEKRQGSFDENWVQLFKSKVHQISNCIPLPLNQQEQIYLFRPDSIDDLMNMLDRILNFCKNIELWQKQKIHSIEHESANLLKIVSGILIKHPQTKQTISQQISQIEQLRYLVNFIDQQQQSLSKLNQNKKNSCNSLSISNLIQKMSNENREKPIFTKGMMINSNSQNQLQVAKEVQVIAKN